MPQTMFFTFKQNNNNGRYYPIMYKYIIVEAEDAEEANNSESIKWCIHFNKGGNDCSCCGPRWTKVTDSDATEVPMINGLDVTDPVESPGIDGAFFIQFKDKVVKSRTGGFTDQYVSTEVKSHATTEEEKLHEKAHAQEGQGGGSGENGESEDSKDDTGAEDADSKDSKEEVKLDKLSDKELKELGKKLKDQAKATKSKGWFEQKWD